MPAPGTVQSTDTLWPACSVEFCPAKGEERIFACGTYKLDAPPNEAGVSEVEQQDGSRTTRQHRRGQCLIYELEGDSARDAPRLLATLSSPAILDMKWCHRTSEQPALLGVANSEGEVVLHEWKDRKLHPSQVITCSSRDVLCLSMDWSNRRNPTNNLASLVVSLSDNTLALLRPDAENGLSISDTWTAHDFEPWVAAWDYWNDNIIYSGGDDLKLKGWDARQGFSNPTFVNRRFDGGVTSIQSHPYREHLLAVGSYDSHVRLFDVRKAAAPIVQTNTGGGVWRVKWHPDISRQNDLLVACMHDGFKVLRYTAQSLGSIRNDEQEAMLSIVNRFDEHKSLAYGVDWSFAEQRTDEGTTIASCSFYDHLLCVWTG